MTWLMKILKIYLKEQLLIKYCEIKHLILLKIQNMMDITQDVKNTSGANTSATLCS